MRAGVPTRTAIKPWYALLIVAHVFTLPAYAELDGLKSQLMEIIKKEESKSTHLGFRRLHGTEACGLAQILPSSHCDSWVEAVRTPLTQVKLAKGQQARISEVITDWNGPGGRHNLYVGFVKDGARVTVFSFDPWQHQPDLQFRILKPNPKSGLIQMGSAQIKYDPITEMLFYQKAPSRIPETSILTGSELDASGDPIELLGEGSSKLRSLSLKEAVCAGAESTRLFLGEALYRKQRNNKCSAGNFYTGHCQIHRQMDRQILAQQAEFERILRDILKN